MGQPNHSGYFGQYGGRYVPETIVAALDELEREYRRSVNDDEFKQEFTSLLQNYSGRPTPLYYAKRLSDKWDGAKIYLKREDLNHTGAHKINNCLGQALLASRMNKKRIIAETGAGQHGVAVATVCCLFGMNCTVYMGSEDMVRQAPNVDRMKLLKAEVIPVTSGTGTLKDATNEAIRDWVTNIENTHYIIGSTVGPHPYPLMVRDFQSVIGREARSQMLEFEDCLPDAVVACVGGGSNSLGMFHDFVNDIGVCLYGVESAGEGLATENHAATLNKGKPGILHGSLSYLLQTADGQILPTHSIAAGLDYPGVGPEHSAFKDSGRVKYESISDSEALKAFIELSETEGIIPALESSFALAFAKKLAGSMNPSENILICLSGRGDKDLANENVARLINQRTQTRERTTDVHNIKNICRLHTNRPESLDALSDLGLSGSGNFC